MFCNTAGRTKSVPLLLFFVLYANGQFGLHHVSNDAEEYGEEDQPLRWARILKNFEKNEKISSVWRWGEVTRWRWVGVPPPGVCWFIAEAKRQLNYVGQVIFKIAWDPSIHKFMAIKGGSKHPLPLSQPYTIRRSTPLRVRRGKHRGDTRKVQEADPDGLLQIASWTFSCQSLWVCTFNIFQHRQEVVRAEYRVLVTMQSTGHRHLKPHRLDSPLWALVTHAEYWSPPFEAASPRQPPLSTATQTG